MKPSTAANMQGALAIIGLSLFAFGVWLIYPPACYILVGLSLTTPFLYSFRTVKQVES